MKMKFLASLAAAMAFSLPAAAVQIDFTGGTVFGGGDYYEENGFRVDPTGGGSTAFFGDYYGVGNNVIHAHWLGGCCGNITDITITKIGGGAFDLNYFILTSNTTQGGGPATGGEQAFIQALGGVNNGYTQMLPPEDWGFPATQIFLGSQFDDVTSVRFYVNTASGVDCFGMDEFFIDEAAPPNPNAVSEPLTAGLLGLGLLGVFASRRRTRK